MWHWCHGKDSGHGLDSVWVQEQHRCLKVTPGPILPFPFYDQIQKRHSSGSMDDRPSLSARDYVESLHQNSRATLLYGKNNVLVQPVS
jgi:hypothetical protein